MQQPTRCLVVCLGWLALPILGHAQEVAILQCNAPSVPDVELVVDRLTLSEGAGLAIDHVVSPQLDCAETMSTILSEGFELRLTHTNSLAYTFIFVEPAPRRPVGREHELVLVGCTTAQTSWTHRVRFYSSSGGAPGALTGESSNCAEELARVMRAGLDLAHGEGATYADGILLTLHAGSRPFLLDANALSVGPRVATATIECRQAFDSGRFFASFAESSFGGPVIATGNGVECAQEATTLLEQGFRVLDIQVGWEAKSSRWTLLRGFAESAAGNPPRPARRRRRRQVDVALLQCSTGFEGRESRVLMSSLSVGLSRVPYGEPCQPALSARLNSGFVLIDLGGERFAHFLVYTLVRASAAKPSSSKR